MGKTNNGTAAMRSKMPKFRKKPVVIEAIQWDGSLQTWNLLMDFGFHWSPGDMGTETFSIYTLEGKMLVSKKDWVIKGVKGECYPCKPDIFDATYEEVKDAKG